MVRISGLREDEIHELAAVFRVLSDPTRLRLVSLLAGGERNVGDLCAALRQSQPTVSHHLSILRMHAVIAGRRQGKHVYYSLLEPLNGRVRAGGDEGPGVSLQSLAVRVRSPEGDREVGAITFGPGSTHPFANAVAVPPGPQHVH